MKREVTRRTKVLALQTGSVKGPTPPPVQSSSTQTTPVEATTEVPKQVTTKYGTLLVVDRFGWAFHRIANHLASRLPGSSFTVTDAGSILPGTECETVVFFWWPLIDSTLKKLRAKRKLICVYDGWSYKMYDFPRSASLADGICVANEEFGETVRKLSPNSQIFLCEDGVDTELFRPLPFPKKFTVGWAGNSNYHWPGLKGLDLIQEACSRLEVRLVLADKAKGALPYNKMPNFYSGISCYVCASSAEGTPNPVLESLSCGRPVVSTDVGIVSKVVKDGVNGFIVDRTVEAIVEGIEKVRAIGFEKMTEAAREAALTFDWNKKVKAFLPALNCSTEKKVRVIRTPVVTKPPGKVLGTGRDLSDLLTAFVSTIGDPLNYPDCIKHLQAQTCQFRFEEIRNVAPMDRAFQTMIDQCQTPFYIQVDEDMLLYPNAVSELYNFLQKQPPEVAIVCLPLWDVHLQRVICGCKIYKHDIVKRFPYGDNSSHCDVSQVERLQAAGYKQKVVWNSFDAREDCVGEHGVHYTPETAFEAYRNRLAKSRLNARWIGWVRVLLREFERRYLNDPTPLNRYAFLGAVTGMVIDPKEFIKEKDFRVPLDDFRRLHADLSSPLPTELSLHVTSKCNFKCTWCRRQGSDSPELNPDMSLSIVEKVLKKLPRLKSVCIAGFGEPLLHQDLPGLLKPLRREGLTLGLITNGSLLLEKLEMVRKLKFKQISISLNATTKDLHEHLTGTKTFETTLKGIRKAAEAMPGRVGISFVCHRTNLHEMPMVMALGKELHLSFIDFINLLPHNTGLQWEDDIFWSKVLTQEDPEIRQRIEKFKKLPEASLVRSWPVLISRSSCPRKCQSPFISISVDAKGRTSPCRRVSPPSETFGYISDAPPPWQAPETLVLRASLVKDGELTEVCKKCFGNWSQ